MSSNLVAGPNRVEAQFALPARQVLRVDNTKSKSSLLSPNQLCHALVLAEFRLPLAAEDSLCPAHPGSP